MPPPTYKKDFNHLKNNELSEQIVTGHILDLQTTKKANISEDWMDLEQNVLGILFQSKKEKQKIQKYICMLFYNKKDHYT